METSREMSYRIYKECERKWNENHECAWINGDMNERVKLYQEVKSEMFASIEFIAC